MEKVMLVKISGSELTVRDMEEERHKVLETYHLN